MMRLYSNLFIVSFASLAFELLLTRIFSVTMMYHLAFIAIAVGMFGTTIGALIVYLFPKRFPTEAAASQLSLYALLFALSMPLSVVGHLQMKLGHVWSPAELGNQITLIYLQVAIPFIFSGICICLALTRFRNQLGALYATDLIGAALGCASLPLFFWLFDGVTAVIALAAMVAMASAIALGRQHTTQKTIAALSSGVMLILVPANLLFHFAKVETHKGQTVGDVPIYEKWNSFSRVMVCGSTSAELRPFFWGPSSEVPKDAKARQLSILIDSFALTVMPEYRPPETNLDYLRYDITNLGYSLLNPGGAVFIIGTGGGRDILSALAAGASQVTAVEINGDIINLIRRRYVGFTDVALDPRVSLVEDEARSYLTRQPRRYDFIQFSLVDTFAATASGAFVFTENSIYTKEGWKLFLSKLSPHGVLSCSHWFEENPPATFYRIIALATETLKERGVLNPQSHIVVAKTVNQPRGVATILVSPSPFTSAQVENLRKTARELNFEILIDPQTSPNGDVAEIVHNAGTELYNNAPFRLQPPTDDNPFIFQKSKATLLEWLQDGSSAEGGALRASLLMTLACLAFPAIASARRPSLKKSPPYLAYFLSIGLGFMFFEVAQLQRLTIFLGHPSYALPVVLSSLLIATGVGSYCTHRFGQNGFWSQLKLPLVTLIIVLLAMQILTPAVVQNFAAANTPVRVAISLLLIMPAGLLMGTAFPAGMRKVPEEIRYLDPWLWAVNGAGSVCAATLALLISMSSGISMTFAVCIVCYVCALLASFLVD